MISTEILFRSFESGCRLDYQPNKGFKAIEEKKVYCCGIKKRASGESKKQLVALKAAKEQLKSLLADESRFEDSEQLYQIYQKLKSRLFYLHSHTTGFFGWLLSLFRSKKETKALKKLRDKIQKLQNIMIRSEKVSLEAFKKAVATPAANSHLANETLFKKIEEELPHLIRSTAVTAADFGITEANPHPKTPFLLRKYYDSIYIYFPPVGPASHTKTPSPIYISNIRKDVQAYYYNHLIDQKSEIARSCDNFSEELKIENILCDAYKVFLSQQIDREKGSVILTAEVFNPITGKKETSFFPIQTTTTKAAIDSWVRGLINESERHITEVKDFITKTISSDLNKKPICDENGITVDWKGKYLLDCKIHGKSVHAVSLGLGEQSYHSIKAYKDQATQNLLYQNKFSTSGKNVLNFLENSPKLTIDVNEEKQIFKISLYEDPYFCPIELKKIPFNVPLESTIQSIKKDLYLKKNASIADQTFESVSPLNGFEHVSKLPKVPLDKLSTWAHTVNYSGHNLFEADDGTPITPNTIKAKINFILSIINLHKRDENPHILGIPDNLEDRKKYFYDLEARLTHIINALERPQNRHMIPEVIINLGVGGCHCGGRWKEEVNKYYNLFCNPEINEKNVDLDQWLQYLFDQEKKEIVNKMVANVKSVNTSHVLFRYLIQLKQDKITVPGWEVANFNDDLESFGGGLTGHSITTEFKKLFNLSKIFGQMHTQLNKHLCDYSKPMVCQNFGAQVLNHLQMAVKEHFLPYDIDKQAAYNETKSDNQRARVLNSLIDTHRLIIEDSVNYTPIGVTYEGALLLAFRTGLIKLSPKCNVRDLIIQLGQV